MSDIRTRRVACGLSQEDLAALADVSTSTVRNVEKARVAAPRLLEKIETALQDIESGSNAPRRGPALLYLAAGGAAHAIDAEDFDPASLPPRDRVLCRALLTHVVDRFAGGAS